VANSIKYAVILEITCRLGTHYVAIKKEFSWIAVSQHCRSAVAACAGGGVIESVPKILPWALAPVDWHLLGDNSTGERARLLTCGIVG